MVMVQLRLVSMSNLAAPVSSYGFFPDVLSRSEPGTEKSVTDLWLSTDWKDTMERQKRKAAQHISKVKYGSKLHKKN